jgi:carboxyl-terminal processing protease
VVRFPRPWIGLVFLALALSSVVPTAANAAELATGIGLVERGYLFTDEIDGPKLFGEALRYVEGRIPELRVAQLDGQAWLVTTERCAMQVEPPPNSEVHELVGPLEEVARFIDECVDELPEKLMPAQPLLLQGFLSGLDPYSTVLDGRTRTEHSIQFRGKLAGIGARIGVRDDALTLISVYPESPADRAGLKADDIVLRIDQLSATNILVSDAVERIRGEDGTVVNLLIGREGETDPIPVAVTRGIVLIPSVTSRVIGDVIYADISHFSQTTPQDFRKQVGDLLADSEQVRGVLIDLRQNSGGSMLGSSSIGDLFLPQGVLIRTAGRDGMAARGLTSEVLATAETPFLELPVVFLSSPRTASGSELLAASLRNHDRAIVIGERSYGKGTIQKTFGIGATSTLKMTVGHFLPNGIPIPGGGLIPDVEIRRYTTTGDKVGVPFEKSTQDLPFWLRYPAWAGEAPARAPFVLDITEIIEETVDEKSDEDKKPTPRHEEPVPDPDLDATLALGLEILTQFGDTSAAAMLERAGSFLSERAAEADKELIEVLNAQGIDWTAGARPPEPSLHLQVEATETLQAGVEGKIKVTVTNLGGQALHRLRGRLEARGGGLGVYPVAIGRVAGGASITRELTVKPATSIRTGRTALKLVVFDDEGDLPTLGPAVLAVAGNPRPVLALRYRHETHADGSIAIDVDIRNDGDGPADQVRGRLEHPLSSNFEILEGTGVIEQLAPGETSSLAFRVRPLEELSTNAKVHLLVGEGIYGNFLDPDIPLYQATDASAWLSAPSIRCLGIRRKNDTTWEVVFEVSDDKGVAAAWIETGDRQAGYVENRSDGAETVQISAEWKPADGVSNIHVMARDSEGLTAFFRTGL